MAADDYLWDGILRKPASTTMRAMSDIEHMLRPLSIVRSYEEEIYLPNKFRNPRFRYST
jgi:hypothetical protein